MIYIRKAWDGSWRGRLDDIGIYGEVVGETAEEAQQRGWEAWGERRGMLIFIGGQR